MARRTIQNDDTAAVSTPNPVRRRAAKPATPKGALHGDKLSLRPVTPAKAKVGAPSKADRVRALLDQGKSVREISQALDDVTWAYAWDIAAAYEKKTGKVFIPSHAKDGVK